MFRFLMMLIFPLSALHWAHAVTDITFFSVSDTHYGQTGNGGNGISKDLNRAAIIGVLNSLTGVSYPSTVGGGTVAAPRGVIIPGDLIERPDSTLWNAYKADYGVNSEGRLKIPLYDGLGNHDVLSPTYVSSTLVSNEIIKRNGLRVTPVNLDSSNLHYSWDWDGIHFVHLNLFSGSLPFASTANQGIWDPHHSIEFLQNDLQTFVGTSGRPVFVMQHFDFPNSNPESYWPNSAKTNLVTILKNYNCIGILHGHSHAKKVYKFPANDAQALDIYDDGTAMNGDIFVFHITDGRLFVVNRLFNNGGTTSAWGTIAFQKTINMGTPATALRGAKIPSGAPPSSLTFSIAGLGRIYAGNRLVRKVEIVDLSGRKVLEMPMNGSQMTWDRRDNRGNAVAPGLYLIRFVTDTSPILAKALLR